MNFFAVAIVLALFAAAVAQNKLHAGLKLTPEQEEKFEILKYACIEEIGADEEAVLAFHKGDFSNADDKVKCYSKCFQGKLGYYENGVINEATIQKQLGPLFGEEQIEFIQAKCNGVKGTNDCDTAFEMFRCYFTEKTDLLA